MQHMTKAFILGLLRQKTHQVPFFCMGVSQENSFKTISATEVLFPKVQMLISLQLTRFKKTSLLQGCIILYKIIFSPQQKIFVLFLVISPRRKKSGKYF